MPNTREKLEVIAHLGDHITYKEDIGICYDSALAKVIEDAYMTLKNGVTVPEWISVKDRLPEYGERVIACGANGGVFMAKATTTPGFGKVDGANKYRTFNYWMPLPQPPKGE